MATAVTARGRGPAPQEEVNLREPRTWRSIKSRLATILMVIAFIVVLIPLGFVLWTAIARGVSIFSGRFFTQNIPFNVAPPGEGGMWPAILGTLIITGLATVIAVPLGVLGAIYLNEYGGNSILKRIIAFMADVMTGVPSIVMGLFIFTLFTVRFGFRGIGGSLALAALMLPIIIRSSEEMLKLVPNSLREGAYALGATKARVTMTTVLPAAIGGIVSGALLAVARAAGETAPLLFTIGAVQTPNGNVFEGANTSLPNQIFSNATMTFPGAQARAWGAALTLIILAFLLMIAARLVTARFGRYASEGA